MTTWKPTTPAGASGDYDLYMQNASGLTNLEMFNLNPTDSVSPGASYTWNLSFSETTLAAQVPPAPYNIQFRMVEQGSTGMPNLPNNLTPVYTIPLCPASSPNLTCNSATCTALSGTVNYSVTGSPISLQMVNVHDSTTNNDYQYTFPTPPLSYSFPTTPGHAYTASVTARIANAWYTSNCPAFVPNPCPGSLTANASCGNQLQAICGMVTAPENVAALANVTVELRDSLGRLISTQKTTGATTGYNFSFSGLNNGSYLVDPVVGRTEYASPLQTLVKLAGGIPTPATVPFSIVREPAQVTVSDSSGTLVLVTTTTWPTATPPPAVNRMAPTMPSLYSGIIGANGTTVLNVPGNFPYSLTCWRATGQGTSVTYNKSGAVNITGPGGGNVMPLNSMSVACPQ